jgi:hypothetical protein
MTRIFPSAPDPPSSSLSRIGPKSNIHTAPLQGISEISEGLTCLNALVTRSLTSWRFGHASEHTHTTETQIKRRRSPMSKSLTIWTLIGALGIAGCMTEGQFLASRQPTAIQSAVSRGQFEMNCPNATGEVLSQELTQPALQGPIVQGESRGLFTIGVAGCGQRRVYQVFCPMGGDSCTALEGQTS